jgi:hypothetical protein
LTSAQSGSVVFVIEADGEELLRSKLTKSGQVPRDEIDLTGKQKLELIVEDGGDGTRSDWGLWLEPTLER